VPQKKPALRSTSRKHGVATKEKWDELYRIVNENFDSAVFVLDELDMLVGRRDKQEPAFSRLLYQLSRAGANNDLTAHVSVVAISNDTKMMESVGSRALSSFTPKMSTSTTTTRISSSRSSAGAGMPSTTTFSTRTSSRWRAAFAAQTHGDARKGHRSDARRR